MREKTPGSVGIVVGGTLDAERCCTDCLCTSDKVVLPFDSFSNVFLQVNDLSWPQSL